VSFYTLFVST